MNTFGGKLKALRERKEWTQKLTAEKMGVSPQMYNNYERNKTKPSLEILKRVCDVYDTNLDILNSEYDSISNFLKSVELEEAHLDFSKSYKEIDKELHYLIPSLSGIGSENLVDSDLYNDKINYGENEFFFFRNTDIEYSPERLNAGDLLYCEGINPNKDVSLAKVYLIYSKSEDKYYIRKLINPDLVWGIIKGLEDTTQKNLLLKISESNIKDYFFFMTDLPNTQKMLVVNKNEVMIIGQIRYVIYSPMIDLYENAGIDFRDLAKKQLEEESAKFQEKLNNIRQNASGFSEE